jgi:hypothetical protein
MCLLLMTVLMQAGEVSCGKGGDLGGSLYVDYFCCDSKQVHPSNQKLF